jgi:hypothetical protein
MENLILERVRCFTSRTEVPLKPVTILVGENNTGKTTFLACIRVAWEVASGRFPPDFNRAPFPLGGFRQIVSKSTVGDGQVHSDFAVGFTVPGPENRVGKDGIPLDSKVQVLLKFEQDADALVSLKEYEIRCDPVKLSIIVSPPSAMESEVRVEIPSGKVFLREQEVFSGLVRTPNPFLVIFPAILQILLSSETHSVRDLKLKSREEIAAVKEIFVSICRALGDRPPYAFSPSRSVPERMQGTFGRAAGPGSESALAGVSSALSEGRQVAAQRKQILEDFGRLSGLFDAIEVRSPDTTDADASRISLKMAGNWVNLVDCGYGVSQVLPLLTDILSRPSGQMFLLQQPEVHLHPRAQAELATFLGKAAKNHNKRFVVETHSDYLIDRLRMDVRDGNSLTADDVCILYFERKGSEVMIHSLSVDEHGNIQGAPAGYRKFFLEEERRFFRVA